MILSNISSTNLDPMYADPSEFNESLIKAINSEDYYLVEKLARLSDKNKIPLDVNVFKAAKEKRPGPPVSMLLVFAYNPIPTFFECTLTDDDCYIVDNILREDNSWVTNVMCRAVDNECWKLICMLINSNHGDRCTIFKHAFLHKKTNVIEYLQEHFICDIDLNTVFRRVLDAPVNMYDFELLKYCINECKFFCRSMLLDTSTTIIYSEADLNNDCIYKLLECIILLLNKGLDIDVIPGCFPDRMILMLSKMGVCYFGQFSMRMLKLFIDEYKLREEVRETVSELPDEITNLIMGY